jgi:hypothetical protein
MPDKGMLTGKGFDHPAGHRGAADGRATPLRRSATIATSLLMVERRCWAAGAEGVDPEQKASYFTATAGAGL